jgi:putative thioredoxin
MPIDVASFQEEVIQASHRLPIVVDFWAEWCGPCRVLGPVLEALEAESEGEWRLAKVDVQDHQDIATQYKVSGIPAVKLFVDGSVTSEFTGALPEEQVRRWLDAAIPTEASQALVEAESAFDRGERDLARSLLETATEEGLDPEGQILLSAVLFGEDPERAVSLVSDADETNRLWPLAESVRFLGSRLKDEPGAESEIEQRYLDGIRKFRDGDVEGALKVWIDVVGSPGGRKVDEDGARRACIAVFHLLGESHPITQACRRPFSTALY